MPSSLFSLQHGYTGKYCSLSLGCKTFVITKRTVEFKEKMLYVHLVIKNSIV